MTQPAVIPSGGYNQEAQQDSHASAGYIYSNSGDDLASYMQDVYPSLPANVSSGTSDSPDNLTLGVPGQNSIPSTTTIYPYEGDAPSSLPRTLTINAGTTPLEFMLIARIVSLIPIRSAESSSSSHAIEWRKGEIERHTVTTLYQDNVLQELVGENGDRYALVSAFEDPESSAEYAPDQLDGLANMPLPKGYTYESRILTEDLVLTSTDIAQILICTNFNFQLYATTA